MNNLDAGVIRRTLDEAAVARLGELEIFAEIDSTNSYLMQQPGPSIGRIRVAATDNQTAGRGRHGRTWQSPPGSGLCLSMAYTFALHPTNLPAVTLAVGLGVIEMLQTIKVTGVQLKWPNDLIAADGKLGGILTEVLAQAGDAVTVVTGIGLNIDLDGRPDLNLETTGAIPAVDLKSHVAELPDWNQVAARLVSGLSRTFADFEAGGFAQFRGQWLEHDWLFGREVIIDTPRRQISGVGCGIADDGALLVDTPSEGRHRVTSGSVVMASTMETTS